MHESRTCKADQNLATYIAGPHTGLHSAYWPALAVCSLQPWAPSFRPLLQASPGHCNCARRGKASKLDELLKSVGPAGSKPLMAICNSQGQSLLHQACHAGHLNVVQSLLRCVGYFPRPKCLRNFHKSIAECSLSLPSFHLVDSFFALCLLPFFSYREQKEQGGGLCFWSSTPLSVSYLQARGGCQGKGPSRQHARAHSCPQPLHWAAAHSHTCPTGCVGGSMVPICDLERELSNLSVMGVQGQAE